MVSSDFDQHTFTGKQAKINEAILLLLSEMIFDDCVLIILILLPEREIT